MASKNFFENKKIIITGGSSGIGRQLAADLLKAGAVVTIVSSNSSRLSVALEQLRKVSSDISSLKADVSDLDNVRRMAAEYRSTFGAPDILINNAGFAVYRTFLESSHEEISRLISVNLLGAMFCTREFLPDMTERGNGNIVNISSIAGSIIITPNASYCAAKHGLVALSEALRAELCNSNIKVHVVCPGRVETEFFDHETFQRRVVRKETGYTVPVEKVSEAVLRAIEKDKLLIFVPGTLGLLTWLVNALPWPFKAGMAYLNRSRVKTYYGTKKR